jgi:hypothetical protein
MKNYLSKILWLNAFMQNPNRGIPFYTEKRKFTVVSMHIERNLPFFQS